MLIKCEKTCRHHQQFITFPCTVLKILCEQLHNDVSKSVDAAAMQHTIFMHTCYSHGQSACRSMAEALQKPGYQKLHWVHPKLASLPQAFQAFALNVVRTHLQVVIHSHSADFSPPKWLNKKREHHLFQFHNFQIYLWHQKKFLN